MVKLADLIKKIVIINNNLEGRRIQLGGRYSRKYIDLYDIKMNLIEDSLSAGTSSEINVYLDGMLKTFSLIEQQKQREKQMKTVIVSRHPAAIKWDGETSSRN